ncbi:MAG: hypothetical protein ABR591_04585 [Candidatus Velthaea sp.]
MVGTTLTADQLRTIGARLIDYAASIDRFLGTHPQISDTDFEKLDDAESDLNDLGKNLVKTAANIAFADAAQTFTNLAAVTDDAQVAARQLVADETRITKACKVGTAMIRIATSLNSLNPAEVVTAISNLRHAVTEG